MSHAHTDVITTGSCGNYFVAGSIADKCVKYVNWTTGGYS